MRTFKQWMESMFQVGQDVDDGASDDRYYGEDPRKFARPQTNPNELVGVETMPDHKTGMVTVIKKFADGRTEKSVTSMQNLQKFLSTT
jgi:hypothetical protein